MSRMKPTFISLAMAAIIISVSVTESRTAGPDRPGGSVYQQQVVPRPQGFCGYCHLLTYPAVINKSYDTWKAGKHNKVGCVACHYEPPYQGADEPNPGNSSSEINRHIPQMVPQAFSHLQLGGETIRTRPRIADAGCTTIACHGRPDDKFKTKKIQFTEKVPFVHAPHLIKKNQIDGMQVNCTTCHQHETRKKHFQVTRASCHLCHFANTRFNRGRARCELCHELPAKPIQAETGDETKPITHQMLKKAGVACSSCHFDLVRGAAASKMEPIFEDGLLKTVLVADAGRLKNENCLNCHDQQDYLAKAADKKLMHQKHVTIKNAVCFDCHRPISHRRNKLHQPMPDDCRICHPQPHRYQRLLAAGAERDEIPAMPDPMFKTRSGCLACHVEKKISHKGQVVMKASARTCIQCHSNDYEKMLALWKRELSRKLEKTVKLEKKALDALAANKSDLTPVKIDEARTLIEEGRQNLSIVKFGNGVHNAKYAAAVLEAAIESFEYTINLLEGKDMSGDFMQEE